MFANIVVCASLLVNIVALKSTIRRVLFILRPTYVTCFEKIDDGLDGGVDSGEVITRDAVSITSHWGDIVWLGRMRYSEVVGKQYSLGCKPWEVCWSHFSSSFSDMGGSSHGLQQPLNNQCSHTISSWIGWKNCPLHCLLDFQSLPLPSPLPLLPYQ